jgi:hypothetical protein
MNLLDIKSRFLKYSIVFISDNENAIEKAKKLGISTWLYQSNTALEHELKGLTSHPLSFRSEFWYHTTSRFFALEAFMSERPNEKLIQVEADVWLSDAFPVEHFSTLDAEIAFPLETNTTGSASILFLQNLEAAQKFSKIIRDCMRNDPTSTDMTILGWIYKNKAMNFCTLPTAIGTSESYNPDINCDVQKSSVENQAYFGGVFDALTMGLYLLGEDPRNHRGFRFRYSNQINHILDCTKLEFRSNGRIPYVLNSSAQIPIFNLHNHSKEVAIWSIRGLKQVEKAISGIENHEVRKLRPRILIQMSMRYLLRRIKFYEK